MSKNEKLVRDNIIDFSKEKRDGRKFRYADADEYTTFLMMKLHEEVGEVEAEFSAGRKAANRGRVFGELADLLEVIDAIAQHKGGNMQDVWDAKKLKAEAKGGF